MNKGISIRKMKTDEIDAVTAIWLQENCKAHHFIPEDYWQSHVPYVKEALSQAEVYVAINKETVAGFAGLYGNSIEGIFVSSDMQSKGIGTQLLDYLKAHKDSLTLYVYAKNTKAISFYKHAGFTIQASGTDEETNEADYVMVWHKTAYG